MNTKKNHEISLATAIEMTTRFRAGIPAGFAHSEAYEKAAIQKLLNTKGCDKLRIYFGKDENMVAHTILVAVDGSGNDILPTAQSQLNQEDGEDDEEIIILEDAWRCPPLCPEGSPLNGD
ncbi:MAG TPA: hypothetical protein PKV73_02930 [Agriterribacter sp.]|nr:hypothetical protein [Agriterribacter sp.]